MITAIHPSATIEDHDAKFDRPYIFAISLTAALGGLMFGYDWVVIGGAEIFYERFFHLTSAAQIGWAMSSALIGALFGAMFSGALSDKFGRKPLLLTAGLLFIVTSISTGIAPTFLLFVISRILGGLAIGIASSLSALYIAEVAPASMRGRLVAINQLTIALGSNGRADSQLADRSAHGCGHDGRPNTIRLMERAGGLAMDVRRHGNSRDNLLCGNALRTREPALAGQEGTKREVIEGACENWRRCIRATLAERDRSDSRE